MLKGAAAAGAAAFATPVVLGVYSTAASAQSSTCDPALDSNAVDLLVGDLKRWNLNCDKQNTLAGRYNAQRTDAEISGTGGLTATIEFGLQGVDNLPVECSYYTIDAPAGWTCTARFGVEQANGQTGCSPGATEFLSVPGDCDDAESGEDYPDFTPPPDALPVPYCRVVGGNPNECDSGLKLVLLEWTCCPVS